MIGRCPPFRRRILGSLLIVAIAPGALAATQAERHEAAIAEAKELLDTYYGEREQLRRAGHMLEKVLAAAPDNVPALVQMARHVIKSGQVGGGRLRGGTAERYRELLDRALALDPKHQKAWILKAEACHRSDDLAGEKRALDSARALGTRDPWLWMGYGRYHDARDDAPKALESYEKARQLGPGRSPEERSAYVRSLYELTGFSDVSDRQILELADVAQRERHPRDAWILESFAMRFIGRTMFIEAETFARAAVDTMDFGVGRATLAAALYGRAAEMRERYAHPTEIDPVIAEAAGLGADRAIVLDRFSGKRVALLLPTLREIVR